jgi:hypothetical protein
MIQGNDLRRLIELAFDYVSAETEQQANQAHGQAAMLATETTTFKVWFDLIEYIQAWNSSNEHNYPMGRANALQFFLTRQAELEPAQTGNLSASPI